MTNLRRVPCSEHETKRVVPMRPFAIVAVFEMPSRISPRQLEHWQEDVTRCNSIMSLAVIPV